MIPREIIKKIRQIEIRTNRIVKILTSCFQLPRVTARVEDGQNHDVVGFNQEVNRKRKAADDSSPDFASDLGKPFQIFQDTLKIFFDGNAKFPAQAFSLALIPGNGTVKLLFGDAPEDEAAFHSRYFASSMALTSSHETMSLGLSRWS